VHLALQVIDSDWRIGEHHGLPLSSSKNALSAAHRVAGRAITRSWIA
jgi:hypothetical protein